MLLTCCLNWKLFSVKSYYLLIFLIILGRWRKSPDFFEHFASVKCNLYSSQISTNPSLHPLPQPLFHWREETTLGSAFHFITGLAILLGNFSIYTMTHLAHFLALPIIHATLYFEFCLLEPIYLLNVKFKHLIFWPQTLTLQLSVSYFPYSYSLLSLRSLFP